VYVYGVAKGKLIGCPVVLSQRDRNLPNQDILSKASFKTLPCAADRASVVDVEVRLFITQGIVGLLLKSL
jgi:hypothetical protein